jgi:hypothetical protein
MNKTVVMTYDGMNQDISQSKFSNQFYFEGKNIRILSTDSQSSNSVTNDKGNKLVLTVPTPVINYTTKRITYGQFGSNVLSYTTNDINNTYNSTGQPSTQLIIGNTIGKKNIILFTTDNNGFDCIWKVDIKTYSITLLYLRNLNFNINNPIQALINYENNNIEKVYWVDGVNQMRFINIHHSILNGDNDELIDIESSLINVVGNFKFSQPQIITKEQGGTHTAGMIQYAYTLYRINGASTKLSPLSELVSLDNGENGGGKVNEVVSTYPVVKIPIIDQDYTNLRLYSVKYTYNELPQISLILDKNIQGSTELTHYDTGNIINTLSLEEFSFLGNNNLYIPKHINTKFNRLFSANYQEKVFDLSVDTRTYSYPVNSLTTSIYDSLTYDSLTDTIIGNNQLLVSNDYSIIPLKHNCLNKNFDVYKYKYNSNIIGGTGKFLSWELFRSEIGVATDEITKKQSEGKFFKDREIYRLGVQFYNRKGQISLPKWITDFKVNVENEKSNLGGFYANLKIKFNSDFYVWLNTSSNFLNDDDKPVGFKLLRAERTLNDRSILSQGLINSSYVIRNTGIDTFGNYIPESEIAEREKYNNEPKLPSLMRSFDGSIAPLKGMFNYARVDDRDTPHPSEGGGITTSFESGSRLNGTGTVSVSAGSNSVSGFGTSFLSELSIGDKIIVNGVTDQSRIIQSITSNTLLITTINFSHARMTETFKYVGMSGFGSIGGRNNGRAEIFNSIASSDKRSMVYQFNQLMQFYTPDVTFNNVQRFENSNLNVIGAIKNNYNAYWGKLINKENRLTEYELKIYGAITPYTNSFNVDYVLPDGTPYDPENPPENPTQAEYQLYVDNLVLEHNTTYGIYASEVPLYIPTYQEYVNTQTATNQRLNGEGLEPITGDPKSFNYWGLIGLQSYGQFQMYREYNGEFIYSDNPLVYDVYGNPLIVETGANRTLYNADSELAFYNTYQIMNTDSGEVSDDMPNFRIKELNSWGSRCILFSLNDDIVDTIDRTSLDNIFETLSGHTFNPLTDIISNGEGKVGIISEFILNKSSIYLGLLYGGNDYESRKRTNYVEIGEYQEFIFNVSNELNYHCKNPGDTFISDFKFTKIVKTNTEIYDDQIPQFTEIVNVKLESTINNRNRSDYSVEDWDSRFQPRYEEYQNYNKVYSQESNFFVRKDVDYNFKAVSKFENGIISSSIKIPGEIIDSWLTYLTNDVMYLDGKHGSINCLHSFKDEIYSLQDRAIAQISINPRVQVQGNDGIAIQLGTGQVLDRYNYLSTMTGTLNKWSVTNSPNAFYFYDTLNKTINVVNNELSDIKGMHSYLIKNTDIILESDNPLIKEGVVSNYDYLNNEIVFTFLQSNKSFTIVYNELKQTFTSFYDYLSSMYISYGDLFLALHPDNNKLYEQGQGDYNVYFDTYYPSKIIFNLNPEPYFDCVFDNINFKSEVYINNVDQPDLTLTKIQAYNDYQDSTLTPLVNSRNGNLRRRFRDWNAEIPRQGRNRIRGPWIKLLLQFDNSQNKKLILHDLLVQYTV